MAGGGRGEAGAGGQARLSGTPTGASGFQREGDAGLGRGAAGAYGPGGGRGGEAGFGRADVGGQAGLREGAGGAYGFEGRRGGEAGAAGYRGTGPGGQARFGGAAGAYGFDRGIGEYHAPVRLPTDAGYGAHVGYAGAYGHGYAYGRGYHVTQNWSHTDINAHVTKIQNNWVNTAGWHGAAVWYGPAWHAEYPGAWEAAGWAATTAYATTSMAALASLWGTSAPPQPINYEYGSTVVYQGDTVYLNGEPAGSAQQYYQQASQIAQAGQAGAPPTSDWKPLGVFGLVQPNDSSATQILQIAVNAKGIIGGNYSNVLTDTVLPIKGSVDQKTQRAAWTVGDNKTTIYEAGLYNLTQKQATCLIHTGKDSSQQWLLVRLPPPDQKQDESGKP